MTEDQGEHVEQVAEASKRARARYEMVLDRLGSWEPQDEVTQ